MDENDRMFGYYFNDFPAKSGDDLGKDTFIISTAGYRIGQNGRIEFYQGSTLINKMTWDDSILEKRLDGLDIVDADGNPITRTDNTKVDDSCKQLSISTLKEPVRATTLVSAKIAVTIPINYLDFLVAKAYVQVKDNKGDFNTGN